MQLRREFGNRAEVLRMHSSDTMSEAERSESMRRIMVIDESSEPIVVVATEVLGLTIRSANEMCVLLTRCLVIHSFSFVCCSKRIGLGANLHCGAVFVYEPIGSLTDAQFLGRVTASRKAILVNGVPFTGFAVLFAPAAPAASSTSSTSWTPPSSAARSLHVHDKYFRLLIDQNICFRVALRNAALGDDRPSASASQDEIDAVTPNCVQLMAPPCDHCYRQRLVVPLQSTPNAGAGIQLSTQLKVYNS